MPYASKFKASASIDYDHHFTFGRIQADLTGNYSSRFNWDADNTNKEPEHFVVDGSIAFTPASVENLTLRFWMKNITGIHYNVNYYAQASGSAYSSAPGAPRTFGGELVVKF